MALPGATLRYIVFDILRDFKQRHANADISEFQILYWVLVHADRLRKLHIQKISSGEYLSIFDVSVAIDANNRKYITVPERIYDFDLDRGISFITYEQIYTDGSGGIVDGLPQFSTITFGRTTPATAKRLSYRTEETPSEDNPYFYRIGDLIYFIGVEDVTMDNVEVGIYSTLDPTDVTLDIDQSFDFPQDLIPTLKRQVLDLGIWALQVPKDLKNDGVDGQGQVPQKKFVSVNDVNQQS